MYNYDDEVLEVFLENQGQLFPENVAEIIKSQMPPQEPAPEIPKVIKIDDKTIERKM